MGGIAKSDLPQELRSYYEWTGTHYQIRPEAAEAFWHHYDCWARTSAGQAWLESARMSHAATALVSRWRLGRVLPRRVFFVHVCSVFGWTVDDFFPGISPRPVIQVLGEVFPRNGRNNPIIGVDHRQQFRDSLERLWADEPSKARRHAAKMRAWYNWLQKVKTGLIRNVSPDMLAAFARAIGRSSVGLVRPWSSPSSRAVTERPVQQPVSPQRRPPEPRLAEPKPSPAAQPEEPKPWSFFGDAGR